MIPFEMANSDDPDAIIAATQRSFVEAIRGVVKDLQKIQPTPGLTWEQIDYLLVEFGKKKPTVIHQEGEM